MNLFFKKSYKKKKTTYNTPEQSTKTTDARTIRQATGRKRGNKTMKTNQTTNTTNQKEREENKMKNTLEKLEARVNILQTAQEEAAKRLIRELNTASEYKEEAKENNENYSQFTATQWEALQKYNNAMNSAASYRKQLKAIKTELNKVYSELFELIEE